MNRKSCKFTKIIAAILIAVMICGNAGVSDGLGYNTKITAQAATTIRLSRSSVTMFVGNTFQLRLTGASASGVKWSVGNSKVATVSSTGKVTAVKSGTTTVYAKYKNKTYKCTVKAIKSRMSTGRVVLSIGDGYGLDVLHTNGRVTWRSANTKVVRVNANGYLRPVKCGSTKVTAKVGSETYVCYVRIVAALSENDFEYDSPMGGGYTSYIDLVTAKGTGWYTYYKDATVSYKCNRRVNIGDTYADFYTAYGECDRENVESNDSYREYFENSTYPRTKYTVRYHDSVTRDDYYKTFYFDRKGTLVLVVWHM